SPFSQGLRTSKVHSSWALVSTMLVPEVKLKLACGGDCGSVCPSGTQLLWCGAGSLANATLSAWVMPSDTALPAPVKSAGRPISQIAAAQATTIHRVPSMVRLARLRVSPRQASPIAPRITTRAREGKEKGLPRLVTRRSTAPVSQDRMPSPAADWYTVIVTRSRALAASNTTPAMLLPTNDAMSEHCRSKAAHDCPAMP